MESLETVSEKRRKYQAAHIIKQVVPSGFIVLELVEKQKNALMANMPMIMECQNVIHALSENTQIKKEVNRAYQSLAQLEDLLLQGKE